MSACLVVHVHHHGTNLGGLLYVLLWVYNHEVYVERFGTNFRHGFQYRETEGDVGHEYTIHNVHVEPVCFTLIDHFYIALQVNEIG